MSEPSPQAIAAPKLPDALRLGPVHLTVRDLQRAIDWYERSLGLRVHARADGAAELGDGDETVVVLVEDADAFRQAATPGSTTTRCFTRRARPSPAPRYV